MCFSAPASFIAGGVLGAVGVATLSKAKKKSQLPFASIPLLFGIQQIIEGVVWLSVASSTVVTTVATYAYLALSHVFWPIFIPLSILILERDRERRCVLKVLVFIGLLVGGYLLYFIINNTVTPGIVNQSIAYTGTEVPYKFFALALYLISTCGSAFVSSHKLVRIMGALAFALFFVAGWFYHATYVSVWCFFAAVVSLLVYWQIARK